MKPSKKIQRKVQTFLLLILSWLLAPLIFLITTRRRAGETGEPLRILVIPQLTRVGDVICSTPVFYSLKKAYPSAKLAVLVSVMTAPLLENNPRIDELIVLENYGLFQLIRKIFNERFDWSFSLSGTSLSTMLSFLGCVGRRVKITRSARPVSEVLTDWQSTDRIEYKDHSYLPRFYLQLLSLIGITNLEEKKEVFLDPEAEKKAESFLASIPADQSKLIVGISITTGNSIKEWGDDKFFALALKIKKAYNVTIVFIGAPRDRERISKLVDRAKKMDNHFFFEATSFNLKELSSLLSRLQIFVSGDTGPMHMAHALGVPLLDIIGPVHPSELTPRNERSVIVLPNPPVEPSIFAFEKPGPRELSRKALEQTSVDAVFKAFSGLAGNIA